MGHKNGGDYVGRICAYFLVPARVNKVLIS